MVKTVLVTGGAGFIGSNLVRSLIETTPHRIVNLDALTYAGNLSSLGRYGDHPRHLFVEGDICDPSQVARVFRQYAPDWVLNLAAESHVDRSIEGPDAFVQTNVVGTFQLLEAARIYSYGLPEARRKAFRFVQVSTDEVFGSLGDTGAFCESSPHAPNSPYAATKAGADHLVRAYHETYGLNAIVAHCSNNYGPYQFPEKLIPLMTQRALQRRRLPVYGDGRNVRDWVYVADHCEALRRIVEDGKPGETYNIGGKSERTNLQVVHAICDLLDELQPRASTASYRDLIDFVEDRPGHDRRYAMDISKIERELGWTPRESFESGLEKTIVWGLEHQRWCDQALSNGYNGERLGLRVAT